MISSIFKGFFHAGAAVLALIGATSVSAGEPVQVPAQPSNSSASADVYRPAYHFTPRAHWMNDPNGLVYDKGVYHLFFQHNPDATVWGPMHWGHAVSRDLVHWQERPIALAPDALGAIFSGSAVVDHRNTSGLGQNGRIPLLAIFTYHQDSALKAGLPPQSQGLAYSLDSGKSWRKYGGNPVLRPDAGQKDFRDPKVFWHAPTHRWVMALAVGDHTEFFGSPNLRQWKRLSSFGAGLGPQGGVWECPDLLPLRVKGTRQTKWVLIQSFNPGGPNGGSATQYFVGDFDGKTFTLDPAFARTMHSSGPHWLDWGRDNYASVAWSGMPKGDKRTVLIGWMNNWDYGDKTPTQTWRSAMTLPRELSLHRETGGGYVLHSLPLRELRKLQGQPINLGAGSLAGERTVSLPAAAVSQSRIDLAFTIEAGTPLVGVELTNRVGDIYRFSYDSASKTFISDRTASGLVSFSPRFASVDKAPRMSSGRLVRMSLYVDRSSVEAFLDGGATAMTTALFPRAPYTSIKLFTHGGEARLITARTIPMTTIFIP